ncbi:MAG: alpha/beta hydrolase [Phormidesmis priestleyi]|uniref:Alpha/beta hydrolase n=1 Tax=Phormidesmis priestleyi TaxID=268141 RepID=A0A2W4WU88_9CYAN|nr:MAG: alpha/beta hydrolase [Phormidesmis priestleyi]
MLQDTFKRLPFPQNAIFKYTSAMAVGIVITAGQLNAATAAPPSFSQPYESFSSYTTINPVNGDSTDIYFPTVDSDSDSVMPVDDLPIVLLLQGAFVDKGFYSDYASQVARYGFAVAVPNHFKTVPGFGDVLASDTSQIQATIDQFIAESNDASSPLRGKVDPQKLGLLGHSIGGAAGLAGIGEICTIQVCSEPFERPEALLGGAFFGANLRDQNNVFLPIDNEGIGIALIQGTQDGRALPVSAANTLEQIQAPPKALVTLDGVNHFGITNVNMPEGTIPDPNQQTRSQAASIETIARWSGLFLRGTLLEDQAALDYVFSNGDGLDPIVTSVVGERMNEQATPIPEPASLMGVGGGLLSMIVLKKRTA